MGRVYVTPMHRIGISQPSGSLSVDKNIRGA